MLRTIFPAKPPNHALRKEGCMYGNRAVDSAGLLAASLAVAFCCGCSSFSPALLPEVSATQFHLELSADWEKLRHGQPLPIEHRLSNDSKLPVCVGGSQAFLLNGRSSQKTMLQDALCKYPAVIAPPGGTAVWITEWSAHCTEEALPGGLSSARPEFMCGSEISLESEINLFRMRRDRPERGAIKVVSRSQAVRIMTGGQVER